MSANKKSSFLLPAYEQEYNKERNMQFIDRKDAGKQLASKLAKYAGQAVIYALPRGGVVVAAEVARELKAPLDLLLVRKIGHPINPEYAIGAIADEGTPIFNEFEKAGIDENWLKNAVQAERLKNEWRRQKYFPSGYVHPTVEGKVAIVVDDGIATGLTMEAAVRAIQQKKPQKIVVAVPVAPLDVIESLQEIADKVIIVDDPVNFRGAVGAHYWQFPQVEDDEVMSFMFGNY